MATSEEGRTRLINRQIVRLAAAISANNMAVIAEGYMNFDDETIKNKKFENRGQAEAFNTALIQHWRNRNAEPNQVQVRYKSKSNPQTSVHISHQCLQICGLTRKNPLHH